MPATKHKTNTSREEPRRKWSRDIHTDSTHPPPGLFTKDAQTVAKAMASQKVSPRGIGSGIRMIQMFINRAGKNLPLARKKELERAKHILQARQHKSEKSHATSNRKGKRS